MSYAARVLSIAAATSKQLDVASATMVNLFGNWDKQKDNGGGKGILTWNASNPEVKKYKGLKGAILGYDGQELYLAFKGINLTVFGKNWNEIRRNLRSELEHTSVNDGSVRVLIHTMLKTRSTTLPAAPPVVAPSGKSVGPEDAYLKIVAAISSIPGFRAGKENTKKGHKSIVLGHQATETTVSVYVGPKFIEFGCSQGDMMSDDYVTLDSTYDTVQGRSLQDLIKNVRLSLQELKTSQGISVSSPSVSKGFGRVMKALLVLK